VIPVLANTKSNLGCVSLSLSQHVKSCAHHRPRCSTPATFQPLLNSLCYKQLTSHQLTSHSSAANGKMASNADDSGPIYLFQDTHPEWGFMSNWYSSPFHTGDKVIVFQTVEHHMMYHKAKLFSDHEIASEIISSPPLHPSKVQELGRKVKNYNKAVWEEHRERIVEEGSYHKYVHSLRDDQESQGYAFTDRG